MPKILYVLPPLWILAAIMNFDEFSFCILKFPIVPDFILALSGFQDNSFYRYYTSIQILTIPYILSEKSFIIDAFFS